MKLALQIGLGIVIGIVGCWLVGIFFTAAVVSALSQTTHNIALPKLHLQPAPVQAYQPPVPTIRPRIIAMELVEATGERSSVLTRPEYTCIRDRSKQPPTLSCVNNTTTR